MIRGCFLVVITVLCVSVSAQKATTFLATKVTDIDYAIAELQADYVENHNFSSPWMRDLDFRFRTSNGFAQMEEYRVRLGLINPLEIKANAEYNKLLYTQINLKKKASLNDVMMNRFQLLLETYFMQQQQVLVGEKRQLLQQQYEMIINTNTSYNDLLKLEALMTKDELSSLDDQQKLELLHKQSPALTNLDWNEEQMIRLETALTVLDSVTLADYLTRLADLKTQLKEQEIKLKKAESISSLGFVQSEYQLSDKELFKEHLGFQVGIAIPVFNKERPDIQRRQLANIENEVKASAQGAERALKLENMMINLETCLEQYQLVQLKYARIADYENAMNQSSIDLDTYTRLLDYKYFLLEKSLELECSFLGYYLKVLHYQGVLGETPSRNYLSENLSGFVIEE